MVSDSEPNFKASGNKNMTSTTLKNTCFFNIQRAGSSVGEHMTEAHGVGGSIPSLPILFLKPPFSLNAVPPWHNNLIAQTYKSDIIKYR